MKRTIAVAAACAAATFSASSFACSSCGCTLSSDWLTYGGLPGSFFVDFRADYYNQNELRSGRSRVDRGSITFPADREIQQETVNHNSNLYLAYTPSPNWGVTAQLPYFDRFHTTVVEGDEDISASHTKGIGDVRVIASYRGLSADRSAGLQVGIKLPTGSYHNKFIAGPEAGEPLDRGLQPGTGTTDLVLGAYEFGAINDRWDYFGEALVQQPLNSREQFRPGTGLNVSLGARYLGFERVVPQIQLNVRNERRESGAQADIENSGATFVYLSPGLQLRLTPAIAAYAYVQVPVYQRVNGFQIEPRYFAAVGVRFTL
jgi:hypothetical protein